MVRIRGLRVIREFDPWSSPLCTCPHKFTLNPYTGCGHGCIYCYARTYIKSFDSPRPKEDLIINVRKDLSKIPSNALISLSESSDPYTPQEKYLMLSRKVIDQIVSKGFRLLIVTKSDLIIRDLDLITKGRVAVAITITTIHDELASAIEPRAPSSSKRLKAIKQLVKSKVPTIVRIDPIIPWVNDRYDDLKELIKTLSNIGVVQIVSSTLKIRPTILKSIVKVFPHLKNRLISAYLVYGEKIHGYYYLSRDVRIRYLCIVKNLCEKEGLIFTTCREGLNHLNTPGFYCDGSTFTYSYDTYNA